MINMTSAVLALVVARQVGDSAGATRVALAGALAPNPLTGLVLARVLAEQDTRSAITPATPPGSAGTATGTVGGGSGSTVRLVQVPAVDGDTAAASDQLSLVGLAPTVVHVAAPRPAGTVIGTDPKAGVAVPVGSTVTVEVSDGITAPKLVGEPTEQAVAQLRALGLVAEVLDESQAGAPGVVLAQLPDVGLPVGDDRKVALVVRADPSSLAGAGSGPGAAADRGTRGRGTNSTSAS